MRTTPAGRLLLVMVLMWLWFLSCADESVVDSNNSVANTNFAAEASFHQRIDVAAQIRLTLDGISGGITVTAVAGSDSIVIDGVRRVRSESIQDAETHLESLTVNIGDSATEVAVETVQPEKSLGRIYEVHYDIVVPAGLDLDINNINGQIILEDMTGNVHVNLVNGQVVTEATMPSGGMIDVNVVNGGIELSIPKTTSSEFSAALVNGSISMSGLVLQDFVSTSVSLTGTLGLGDGTIALNLVNGTISVEGFD
ncbi:MAG: hypothetical protein ABIJ00_07850 [Candidatus Eisenbacteria bacterium]